MGIRPKNLPLRFIVSTKRSSFARTLPAAPKISTPEQQKVLPAYIGQEHSVLGYKLVNYRCCCSIFLSFPIVSNLVNPAHLKMLVIAGTDPVAMGMTAAHMGRHLPSMPTNQLLVGYILVGCNNDMRRSQILFCPVHDTVTRKESTLSHMAKGAVLSCPKP